MKREAVLRDLREILLWQQLDKQLFKRLKSASPVSDQYRVFLKKFCLKNHLFSRIRASSLIKDLPLALQTDLQSTSFLTINLSPWTRLVGEAIGSVTAKQCLSLDVERALAGAFKDLMKVSRRYDLTGPVANEDDNEGLYDVINAYLEKQERIKDPFTLVQEIYKRKAMAMSHIRRALGTGCAFSMRHKTILVFYEDAPQKIRTRIWQTYTNQFLKPSKEMVQSILDNVTYLDFVLGGLHKRNTSAQAFADYQHNVLQTLYTNGHRFLQDLDSVSTSGDNGRIALCEVKSFRVLDAPFPPA